MSWDGHGAHQDPDVYDHLVPDAPVVDKDDRGFLGWVRTRCLCRLRVPSFPGMVSPTTWGSGLRPRVQVRDPPCTHGELPTTSDHSPPGGLG